MYDGDKNRDASCKIRGFIFQDFVTMMCLLQEKVEYVCSEYIEDVDVFYEDGKFEFIQVKYYPNSSPCKREIFTDLYYQFLRLKILQSNLIASPCLFIHGNTVVDVPTVKEMKDYIGKVDAIPKTVAYPHVQDSEKWLKNNIYVLRKKEDQKAYLFEKMSSENSLEDFVKCVNISYQLNIHEYKENLMNQLAQRFTNNGNDSNWRDILLGLALSYIQRRYMLDDSDFDHVRFDKKDFLTYMADSVQTKSENTIISYLIGIASGVYGDIINNNMLSDLQTHFLDLTYHNTVIWIEDIAKTIDGQYKILNTISMEDERIVAQYKALTIDDRIIKMAECKSSYKAFLEYMWKIILDICQEKVKIEADIICNLNLFNPNNYIDQSVTEYVCFCFPDDRYSSRSVILPRVGGDFNSIKRKIVGRMVKTSQRPEKWFFENNKMLKGKNIYNYSTANVDENPTIIDLGKDGFYIECMECIGVDDTEWNKPEICSECIFSEKCVNERV